MNVFCISDSLGLPRTGVKYEESWYHLIQEDNPDVNFYPFFLRDQTTNALWDIFNNYLKYFQPEYTIVQLGICDCAPRIINSKRLFWRLYFKIFQLFNKTELAWRLVKKVYKRNDPNRVIVPFKKFAINTNTFVEDCIKIGTKVIFISIPTPSPSLKEKSTLLDYNIQRYNSFYVDLTQKYPNSVFVLSPLSEGSPENYVEDGYHSNAIGFKKVSDAISLFLRNLK